MFGSVGVPVAGDIGTWFLQQGPVGVLALVIGIFGHQQLKIERLRGDRERDRADLERARADETAARVVALIERILPSLAESTRATQEFLDINRSRDR